MKNPSIGERSANHIIQDEMKSTTGSDRQPIGIIRMKLALSMQVYGKF